VTDPTCGTCGHPASEHGRPNYPCELTEYAILRLALASAQEEVARLTDLYNVTKNLLPPLTDEVARLNAAINAIHEGAENQSDRIDALTAEVARLTDDRDALIRGLELVRAERDALAKDAELGQAIRWHYQKQGVPQFEDVLLFAYRAALSTPTEGENDG